MKTPGNLIEITFGEIVRRRRIELEISQEELAHRANLHRTFISHLERGKKSPTLTTIVVLIAALDTNLPSFFEELDRKITKRNGRKTIPKGS